MSQSLASVHGQSQPWPASLTADEVKPVTYILPAAYPSYAAGFACPYAGAFHGYTYAATTVTTIAAKAVEVVATSVATVAATTPVT